MDFIEGLPRSDGFDIIFVVVHRLSKHAHFVTLKHSFTAQGVAAVFLKEVIRLHGFLKTILATKSS